MAIFARIVRRRSTSGVVPEAGMETKTYFLIESDSTAGSLATAPLIILASLIPFEPEPTPRYRHTILFQLCATELGETEFKSCFMQRSIVQTLFSDHGDTATDISLLCLPFTINNSQNFLFKEKVHQSFSLHLIKKHTHRWP